MKIGNKKTIDIPVLGIDFGKKFVGLSISEPPLNTAFPYKVLEYRNKKDLIEELLQIIESRNIKHLIVGWPISLEGKETFQTKEVEKFVQMLKKYVQIPVDIVDERLTTKGLPKGAHSSSAALILERWLERQRPENYF